jgi:hypothetical protein
LLKIKINLPDIDQQQVVIDKLMKIEKIIDAIIGSVKTP